MTWPTRVQVAREIGGDIFDFPEECSGEIEIAYAAADRVLALFPEPSTGDAEVERSVRKARLCKKHYWSVDDEVYVRDGCSLCYMNRAQASEAERDRLRAQVERLRALAEKWARVAPDDDWGDSLSDTMVADAGRAVLAALDGE